MKRLEGKVAVITGASQGLGAATAKRFIEEGALICNLDINTPSQAIENLKTYQVDITNDEAVQSCIKQIIERYGKVDILVNNAGIIKDALLNKMSMEQWDQVMNVNLKGAMIVTQALLPYFYQQEKASIINVSSIVGEYGNIGQSNYAATKAGLIGLTYTWAKEFTRKGAAIRTNAVAPGYADTEMMQSVPQKVLDQIIEDNPLKRLANPEEIANTVLFLASDESSYINGQVIGVNGGARL